MGLCVAVIDLPDGEIDVLIFEQGQYRTPLRIISEYEAGNLLVGLFACMSEEKKKQILAQIERTQP